ncbi:hypothetical protein NQ315_005016 [Exocentrus adspersus]|uniref:G-protein coupled receptors family 1 profile domain-containing protein n=1 Tax=Exocentrus adspersus TaxID=1586481 RepID=A0AAV8VPH5_9CUCU|nr:hypothetical protein NQ315_005016 [Exocentrus adspersus]
MSLKKAREISVKCNGKRKDHTNLTITLISIIILFLLSEIPAALVSRTNAVPILFSGNHDRANSRTLEVVRQICTLLGAVNVTTNFFFYYLFCPAFVKALGKTFQNKKNKVRKSVQVNVFVVNGEGIDNTCLNTKVKAKIIEISRTNMELSNFQTALFKGTEDKNNNNKDSENSFYCEKTTIQSDVNDYVEIVDDYRIPHFSVILEESSEFSGVSQDSCEGSNLGSNSTN